MYFLRNICCTLPASLPLLAILAMTFQLVGCAQAGKLIRTSHAFYVQRQPGTVRVDPSTGEEIARKPDTLITIYAETAKKDISWDTAWRNGRAYMVRAVLAGKMPVEAGTSKDGDRKIVITPGRDNFLWQLQLLPLPAAAREVPATKGVLLRAIYKGIHTSYRTEEPVELESIPSV